MVTQKQIAEILGISRTTVARALKQDASIKLETKQKVLELVQEMNYEKNYLGSSLAGKEKRIHAFIVKSRNQFYTDEIKRGMKAIQKKYAKYRLRIEIHSHDISESEKQFQDIQSLIERESNLHGLLIVPLEKEKLYELLKEYREKFPILSLTMRLHESFPHVGVDYKEQGKMVAAILSHCLSEKQRLLVLDNGDDKLSTKEYLDGFLERIGDKKDLEILGPYAVSGVEESVETICSLEETKALDAIFSNRYAHNIISMLPDSFFQNKKIVLSGMGESIRELLEEKKVIATVMEEVYEDAYLAGKLLFDALYRHKTLDITWKKTKSKVIYLENLEKNRRND